MIDSRTPFSPGFIVRREKVDEMCSNSKGFITGLLQRIPRQLHDEPYFNGRHFFPEHFNDIHQSIYSTSSLIHTQITVDGATDWRDRLILRR